jgi:glucan biosynthesis protein C
MAQFTEKRRYDIDWLRVIATLTVFVFHNLRFYDEMGWHLKNDETGELVLILVGFLDAWLMPIFFFISGIGTWYGLKHKKVLNYIGERFRRLIVPLLTVGLFILIPPQYYWEICTNQGFEGSFFESLPLFFNTLDFSPGLDFLTYWHGHLWFLAFLFYISVFTLPVTIFLKSGSGKKLIKSWAGVVSRPFGSFLFALPLICANLILQHQPGNQTLGSFIYYAMFFLSGYIFTADQRFTTILAEKREMISLFAAGSILFGLIGYIILGLGFEPWKPYEINAVSISYFLIAALNAWCWIGVLIGICTVALNQKNNLIQWASDAVLPFYILHQTLILLVGYFILPFELSIMAKFITITLISFALIIGIYKYLIKEVSMVRFAFGMRMTTQLDTGLKRVSIRQDCHEDVD